MGFSDAWIDATAEDLADRARAERHCPERNPVNPYLPPPAAANPIPSDDPLEHAADPSEPVRRLMIALDQPRRDGLCIECQRFDWCSEVEPEHCYGGVDEPGISGLIGSGFWCTCPCRKEKRGHTVTTELIDGRADA
jgi:hypothetical protein